MTTDQVKQRYSGPGDRRRWACQKNFRFEGEEVRIRRHGAAGILKPLAEDWGWLDSLVGRLDDDFVRAVNEQPVPQERRARKALRLMRYLLNANAVIALLNDVASTAGKTCATNKTRRRGDLSHRGA